MTGTLKKHTHMKTIVFLTGCFVHHSCWNEWKAYFEKEGYQCIVPPWPHKSEHPATLRARQPDPAIASIRLADLKNHFSDIISQLPEKPVLIGHSFGGLLVQLMLQRDIAAAGVAIHSVPPAGVLSLSPSFLRATWGPLGFFTPVSKSFLMSMPQWQYAFTNGLPLQEQQATYDQLVIPESKHVSRDALGKEGKVDFSKPHVPLLFVAGEKDNIMPASLNYTNFKKYGRSEGVTEYKLFRGKTHSVLGQSGWQENAAYIHGWLKENV